MIVTIQSVSQEFTKAGKEYLKVVGVDGTGKQTTKTVFDNLATKWPLIKENATLEFKLEQKGQFWNVVDIIPVSGQMPTEEHIETELKKPLSDNAPPPPAPAPQAVGMITKEIGDMIRAKYLFTIFGEETQFELIKWYRSQVLGITRIPYDGAKLPKFEAQTPQKAKPVVTALLEDDIPF